MEAPFNGSQPTANSVPRRVGTIFTHDVDGSKRTGRISKVDGVSVHVEWDDEQSQVQVSFTVFEWQELVRERQIHRDAGSAPTDFAVDWRGA